MRFPISRYPSPPRVLALAFAAHLLIGCQWGDCTNGKGSVTRQPLKLDTFHGVASSGSLDIRFYKGTEQRVEVEGQPNLIELIPTAVKDGIWHLERTTCYSTSERFVVHITSPRIDHVAMHGSGEAKSTDTFTVEHATLQLHGSGGIEMSFDTDRLHATVQGSGDLRVQGRCNTLEAQVQGSGDIDAGKLICTDVDALVQGSGDITVWTTGTLNATVQGSGDINYKGQPAELKDHVAGSGRIKSIK